MNSFSVNMGSGYRLDHLPDCSVVLWGLGQDSLFQASFDHEEFLKYSFFSLGFAGGQRLSFKLKQQQHFLQE